MSDRVYPSSTKPNAATAAPPILKPPPSKTQLLDPTRHPHHPDTRTRRRCFCLTCFWSILLLIAILLLAALTATAFYVFYNPCRPAFSVTALKISSFNLTTIPSDDTTHLTTNLNLTLTAKNPNKHITFFYNYPISITVRSNSVSLANGGFSNFTNPPNTIFIVHTVMGFSSRVMDPDELKSLDSDLKRKNGLHINIVMDAMVGVKMEKYKMKKVWIRVKCNGIRGSVPVGKSVIPAVAATSKAKCKVHLRIKTFRWTIFI